jgi:hypothetical protein
MDQRPERPSKAVPILLTTVVVLLLLNLGATALVAREVYQQRHWSYRTDFFRDGEGEGSLDRLDDQGWEIVSARRANDGRNGLDGRWGTEVFLRRRRE